MAGAFKFFDNSIIAVIAAIVVAIGIGSQAAAVAATIPPPGYGDPTPLFKVNSGENFSQQVVVPAGTVEVRLSGIGIVPSMIRGFKPPIVDTDGPVVIFKSLMPTGVKDNGNHRVIVKAPSVPGRYTLLFRSVLGSGRPGWRSDVTYEVTDADVGQEETPTGDKEVASGKMNLAVTTQPIRVSTQWGSNLTMGQNPSVPSSDYGFGRVRLATEVAADTDVRFDLAGGLARPSVDGSPHGWGDWAGFSVGIARRVGDLEFGLGGRVAPSTNFKDIWGGAPVHVTGDLTTSSWLGGWLRPDAELVLSPRHIGGVGHAAIRITPEDWASWLALRAGAQGAENLETGQGWGQGLAGLELGVSQTKLGSLSLAGELGFAPSKPVTGMVTVALRK